MNDNKQIWVCDVCGVSGTLRGKGLKLLLQGQYVCPCCGVLNSDPEVTTRQMGPLEAMAVTLEEENSALAAALVETGVGIELDRLFREIAAAAARRREELIFCDLFNRLEKEYDRIEEEIYKDQQDYERRIARLKQELGDLADAHDVAVSRLKAARDKAYDRTELYHRLVDTAARAVGYTDEVNSPPWDWMRNEIERLRREEQ